MLEKVDYGGKGMTDKQLIETLENIKAYCSTRDCVRCKFQFFLNEKEQCQVGMLGKELCTTPSYWDMTDKERIIKYE